MVVLHVIVENGFHFDVLLHQLGRFKNIVVLRHLALVDGLDFLPWDHSFAFDKDLQGGYLFGNAFVLVFLLQFMIDHV